MKIITTIARVILGLVFLVFGANGFLHFIHAPMPAGTAGQFFGAIFTSGYYAPIFAAQLLGGLLLLIGIFVPLGLTVLGPVLVNILMYHIFMDHAGLPLALVTALLWLVVFAGHWKAFAGIFKAQS